MGFPDNSGGKESTCNTGDLGSIPGLGRSPGEGNGSPLQYSYLENPMDRGAWRATVHKLQRTGHDWVTKHISAPTFVAYYAMAYSAATFKNEEGDFLAVQWLRLHFQGAQFQSLVGELRFYILHGVDKIKKNKWGSPGDSVVKNPPANTGDTGSIPDLGRSRMPWSSWSCAPQLLSPHALLRPQRLQRVLSNKRSRHGGAPSCQPEKSPRSGEDPAQTKTSR